MRLDFNVLWVDDQPAHIEAQVKAISLHMQEEGFQFNRTPCLNLEDVRLHLSDAVFNDEVDLVLVDWDLGQGVRGQDVIGEVRQRIQYKEVIFYSAQTTPQELRSFAHQFGLEGVFCVTRDGLVDEVAGVFDSLVKKVLDLDHTRGIVMGATSDIDHMVVQALSRLYEKLDEAARKHVLKGAIDVIGKRVSGLAEGFAKLQAAAEMEELMAAKDLFTANDRLRALTRVLKMDSLKEFRSRRQAVGTYLNDVVPRRNSLGHRVLAPSGRPAGIAAGEEVVSLEDMRELRRAILALRGEFAELLDALGGQGSTPVP